MSNSEYTFKSANNNHLNEIKSLLQSLDLVYEDLDNHLENFIVVLDGRLIIGCAGFEHYHDVGLLRSIAVKPEYQGKGIGHKLIEEINRNAQRKGIKEFYLLTDSASKFFQRFGFIEISRDRVKDKIKQTYEYSEACPESATVMMKTL